MYVVYTQEKSIEKWGLHLLREVIKFSKDKNIGILELKTSKPEAVKVYHKVGFKDNNSMKLSIKHWQTIFKGDNIDVVNLEGYL